MDKKKANKPKKPRRFIFDNNGELRQISRNESHPEHCVKNCLSMFRVDSRIYCRFRNACVYIKKDGKLYRNIDCIKNEQTADELCAENCRCKVCKDILLCCAFNKGLCGTYRCEAYLCQKYNEV